MSNSVCVRSEAAVSPVIGTILLVAIVVVLAAVIGVVALGLTTQSEAKVVGIVAKENSTGTGMEILLTGGRDVSQLTGLRVSGDAGSVELNETPVGASLNVPNASTLLSSTPGLVTITGMFEDGTEQMIWQGKLGLPGPTPTPGFQNPFEIWKNSDGTYHFRLTDKTKIDEMSEYGGNIRYISVTVNLLSVDPPYTGGDYMMGFPKNEDYYDSVRDGGSVSNVGSKILKFDKDLPEGMYSAQVEYTIYTGTWGEIPVSRTPLYTNELIHLKSK